MKTIIPNDTQYAALQLMTVSQLAEFIASQLDYGKIWKSKFPNCDFTIVDVNENCQYSNEGLLELHRNASGWFGIHSVNFGLDSTTLFAVADIYGGGCDQVCRLYDGIGVNEAEILLREAIRGAIEGYGETATNEMFLLVEFKDEQICPEPVSIHKCSCGGTPVLKHKYSFCNAGHGKSYHIHWVECPECGMQTPAYNDLDDPDPKTMAIAHWNKKGCAGQIFGEYEMTAVSDAPGKTRWMLEKQGHNLAMFCFATSGDEQTQKAEYEQQIGKIDEWIKTFEGLYRILRGQ